MKTRIFTSMLVIALAAALVGGATMALFTDQALNSGNSFAAGTVDILAGVSTLSANAGNMAPGDVRTGTFTVTNDGTLELRYTVTAAGSGALFTIQPYVDGTTYPGDTPAFVTLTGNFTNVVLAPGESATVSFSVTLPITAGNQYQGDTGTVNFTINAVQTANNPLAP